MISRQFVLAVVGPTASGKTDLGIALAQTFGGEIVSADSMQIYTGMEIATAKPTASERRQAVHHMIDFVSPSRRYSVADYAADAAAVLERLRERRILPILVGGTGLYLDALLEHLQLSPSSADAALRKSLEEEYRRVGGEAFLARLAQTDPASAAKLHPHDMRRLVRAMEIGILSGKAKSQWDQSSRAESSPYNPFYIGLNYQDRQLLYDRIHRRVDRMLEAGLLEEAMAAYRMPAGATAVQAIGHKEFFPYFAGECTLEQAVERLKQETRRYAKRQMTWFRRNPAIHWITCDHKTQAQIAAEAVALVQQHHSREVSP